MTDMMNRKKNTFMPSTIMKKALIQDMKETVRHMDMMNRKRIFLKKPLQKIFWNV